MLGAGGQNNSNLERILNLKTENSALARPSRKSTSQESKYQCAVCQMNKVSLSELHWHQTYQHSTEELSLCVIGWKGLVKIVAASSKEKENQSGQTSIYNSFSKKPSQFYYLSSSILRVKDLAKGDLEAPIDCSLPPHVKVERKEDERSRAVDNQARRSLQSYNFQYGAITNVGQSSRDLPCDRNNVANTELPIDCSISAAKLDSKQEIPNQPVEQVSVIEMRVKEENATKASDRWKNEWSCVKDISMEDFERGADNLCRELEDYKRLCALRKATKRKNIS